MEGEPAELEPPEAWHDFLARSQELSGTLDYAKHGLQCHRDVYTVPGLCLDRDSLVQAVGRILGGLFPGSLFSSQERVRAAGVADEAAALLECFQTTPDPGPTLYIKTREPAKIPRIVISALEYLQQKTESSQRYWGCLVQC